MNYLTKIVAIVPVVTLLFGCNDHSDRTLAPPLDAKWVNVTFRVPEGITLLPMEVLYRSERCKTVRYNSSNEPHDIPGYNDFEQPFVQLEGSDIRQLRVAVDGGGLCQWQLNSLMVSFKIADNHPLVKGKKVIDTSYIFDFGDYGLSDGYGTGRAKEVSGDLNLKKDFSPMAIYHIDNTVDLSLFGGNTGYEQWRRRYKLSNAQSISIEPLVHFNKVVTLTPPAIRPGNLTATYPDGRSEQIPHIYPDYQRLLSLR
ncbi:hypothetical protein [Yersinia massiliensis]|uniref:hypothetical protein n=1 Tax=Yersinia massiliensis TaxID=419257 RepID=UPI001643D061|nr:hypothetical protein [Yersinia massiliensis]